MQQIGQSVQWHEHQLFFSPNMVVVTVLPVHCFRCYTNPVRLVLTFYASELVRYLCVLEWCEILLMIGACLCNDYSMHI